MFRATPVKQPISANEAVAITIGQNITNLRCIDNPAITIGQNITNLRCIDILKMLKSGEEKAKTISALNYNYLASIVNETFSRIEILLCSTYKT